MKEFIRKSLKENLMKNMLGVEIRRPAQQLIIMRGISGSGKSTRAKQLVKNGIIHSTDDVIELKGDYREFFTDMIERKDFSNLSRVHQENLKNAIESMKKGVSPVVIDNTNLKADEPKGYVEAALNMGFDEKNIRIEDVGTGGQSAETLTDRNAHGVPLDKIKKMIQSYKSTGDLTVDKIMKAKSRFGKKPSKIAMVVLDDKSKSKLFTAISHHIPKDWDVFLHHMTIAFGKGLPEDMKDDEGKQVSLIATDIGKSDKAMVVKVSGYPTNSKVPHITVAVNVAEGGKPAMSHDITEWTPLVSSINLNGVVTEKVLNNQKIK